MGERGYTRIYIIGSVASGKTTLARQLAQQLNISWYELDNIVHRRLPGGDKKQTPEERDAEFHQIINAETWIIEGVYRPFFNIGLDKADTVIFLNTPSYKRNYRIVKRWLRQVFRLEKANYVPTVKMLLKMFEWSRSFEQTRDEILEVLNLYQDKLFILKDNTDRLLQKELADLTRKVRL